MDIQKGNNVWANSFRTSIKNNKFSTMKKSTISFLAVTSIFSMSPEIENFCLKKGEENCIHQILTLKFVCEYNDSLNIEKKPNSMAHFFINGQDQFPKNTDGTIPD